MDSLLNQCGVLRVDSMKELFTLAAMVQAGKRPGGRRVAIVTNAGGPAILATDACVSMGLELGDLAPATQRKIARKVPEEAAVANPVDLIASADADTLERRACRVRQSVHSTQGSCTVVLAAHRHQYPPQRPPTCSGGIAARQESSAHLNGSCM